MSQPGHRAEGPELVIAFVAPSGTSFEAIAAAWGSRLRQYGYSAETIRLSDLLSDYARVEADGAKFLDQRIPALQEAGNKLRSAFGRADGLALAVANEIREIREAYWASHTLPSGASSSDAAALPVPRQAYLVWSLKHPRELVTLRNIYGSRFLAVSVYAPRDVREADLAQRIATSHGDVGQKGKYRSAAVSIIAADEDDPNDGLGQHVRDVYPLADIFIDASTPPVLAETTHRSVDIAFGAPFITPTKDEYGMFFAHAAGLRSAEMGRQVGAAVLTGRGEVVCVGTNEVPNAGGGQYWPGDSPDGREFQRSSDTSDIMKRRVVEQVFAALAEAGWLTAEAQSANPDEAYRAVSRTRLRDLIEFGRAVHAEMGALSDAALRGVSVKGATMYVTTFPCHHCARHVVSAGIARLVYIHPYPKSLAEELHGDAIQTEHLSAPDQSRVRFQPFLGVAPRQYMSFFEMAKRKEQDGAAVPAFDAARTPRLVALEREGVWDVNEYIAREQKAVQDWSGWWKAQGE